MFRILVLAFALFFAPVFAADPVVTPDQIPAAATRVFLLQQVVNQRDTTETLPFGVTARAVYDDLIAAVSVSDLTDSEKVAVTTILNKSAERRYSSDRVQDQFAILVRALESGSWEEFGIPPNVLPPPSPELRMKLAKMLSDWIVNRTTCLIGAICTLSDGPF